MSFSFARRAMVQGREIRDVSRYGDDDRKGFGQTRRGTAGAGRYFVLGCS